MPADSYFFSHEKKNHQDIYSDKPHEERRQIYFTLNDKLRNKERISPEEYFFYKREKFYQQKKAQAMIKHGSRSTLRLLDGRPILVEGFNTI